jgi:hypothetical protein
MNTLTEREMAVKRLAAFTPRDQTPRYGYGMSWGDDDGIPASGRQTAAIIGTCVCGCLLLIGVLVIVYAQRHGGFSWQR